MARRIKQQVLEPNKLLMTTSANNFSRFVSRFRGVWIKLLKLVFRPVPLYEQDCYKMKTENLAYWRILIAQILYAVLSSSLKNFEFWVASEDKPKIDNIVTKNFFYISKEWFNYTPIKMYNTCTNIHIFCCTCKWNCIVEKRKLCLCLWLLPG